MDFGICFTSTTSKTFPGFEGKLHKETICSCPISTRRVAFGYQVFGPYHPNAPAGHRCEASAGCDRRRSREARGKLALRNNGLAHKDKALKAWNAYIRGSWLTALRTWSTTKRTFRCHEKTEIRFSRWLNRFACR
jgi:hypothetical protein